MRYMAASKYLLQYRVRCLQATENIETLGFLFAVAQEEATRLLASVWLS